MIIVIQLNIKMGKNKHGSKEVNLDIAHVLAQRTAETDQDENDDRIHSINNSSSRSYPIRPSSSTPQNVVERFGGPPSSSSHRTLSLSSVSSGGNSSRLSSGERTINKMREEIARFLSITPHDSAVVIRYNPHLF